MHTRAEQQSGEHATVADKAQNKEIYFWKQRCLEAEARVSSLQQLDSSSNDSTIVALNVRIVQLEQQNKELTQRLRTYQRTIDKERHQRVVLQQKLQLSEAEIQKLRRQIDAFNPQHNQEEVSNLHAQIASLQELCNAQREKYEQEVEELYEQIAKTQQSHKSDSNTQPAPPFSFRATVEKNTEEVQAKSDNQGAANAQQSINVKNLDEENRQLRETKEQLEAQLLQQRAEIESYKEQQQRTVEKRNNVQFAVELNKSLEFMQKNLFSQNNRDTVRKQQQTIKDISSIMQTGESEPDTQNSTTAWENYYLKEESQQLKQAISQLSNERDHLQVRFLAVAEQLEKMRLQTPADQLGKNLAGEQRQIVDLLIDAVSKNDKNSLILLENIKNLINPRLLTELDLEEVSVQLFRDESSKQLNTRACKFLMLKHTNTTVKLPFLQISHKNQVVTLLPEQTSEPANHYRSTGNLQSSQCYTPFMRRFNAIIHYHNSLHVAPIVKAVFNNNIDCGRRTYAVASNALVLIVGEKNTKKKAIFAILLEKFEQQISKIALEKGNHELTIYYSEKYDQKDRVVMTKQLSEHFKLGQGTEKQITQNTFQLRQLFQKILQKDIYNSNSSLNRSPQKAEKITPPKTREFVAQFDKTVFAILTSSNLQEFATGAVNTENLQAQNYNTADTWKGRNEYEQERASQQRLAHFNRIFHCDERSRHLLNEFFMRPDHYSVRNSLIVTALAAKDRYEKLRIALSNLDLFSSDSMSQNYGSFQ